MTWTTQQVKDGVAAWTAILTNVPQLELAFAQGYFFECDHSFTGLTSGSVHAYPALKDGTFYLVLIPSIYDNSTSDIGANSYVYPIKTNSGTGTNRITAKEANARIKRFKDNYKTWIPEQVNSTYGMFQAFDIARQDFECADTKLYFGLISTPTAEVSKTIDLIVENLESTVVYDDFTRPVPPYLNPSAASASFYLINGINS
ncbi:hypothetical protein GR160_07585 [Flavobacterium sp. Sd200]|uniref:hypothetical protein n=1 Tax=Flavobacterium sp. Sd200 TaxID=2692211 RepID=UPI001367C304|nr:hypothetical protein [Flavobacterium sp. Sd200]MXN91089.1 hypothetical protein [Flavobacterium sp. Sd200]